MSETFERPILKEGRKFQVRILRPSEYAILRTSSEQPDLLDGALYTGMRYVELQRLQDNPAWFDPTGFVYLPRQAMLKAKRSQLNRWVKLNLQGVKAVTKFLEARRLPTWETWGAWLREWAAKGGMEGRGLGPKTTRKTWESWLAFYYGQNRLFEIVQSQGHTTGTSLHHYLSMPFQTIDRREMAAYVGEMPGW